MESDTFGQGEIPAASEIDMREITVLYCYFYWLVVSKFDLTALPPPRSFPFHHRFLGISSDDRLDVKSEKKISQRKKIQHPQ